MVLFLSVFVSASSLNSEESFVQRESEISMMKDKIGCYLDELAEYDSAYLVCDNAEALPIRCLYNNDVSEVSSILFGLYDSKTYIGYVIIRTCDYVVLESSLGAIPYNFENSGNQKYIYDYGNYGVYDDVNKKSVYVTSIVANSRYSQYFTYSNHVASDIDNSRSDLSNVPIFRQGSYNCIVCATSHLLLYWNNHGYSGLTPTITTQTAFNSFMTTINGYFSSYANNNIPSAIINYALTRRYGIGSSTRLFVVTPQNTWNPEFTDVVNELSNGRPVLLGFAPGSDYSSTVGHMTLCVGVSPWVVENNYVSVVDGHSSSIVTKLWSSDYNDFMCSMTVGLS